MPDFPMSDAQRRIFQEAARQFSVFILVRRTNLASLRFVGQPNCVPKRFDCKAKTADLPYRHPHLGLIDCAGLVVDPTLTGAEAFATTEKYHKALKEWRDFNASQLAPEIRDLDGQRRLTYIPRGGQYFVDLNPHSQRHGCVCLTTSSLLTAGRYIHGDFDLYGIVPAADPARNVAVVEQRMGQTHARSPEFLDVQLYLNRRIGVPMVLHGAQESYFPDHSDEGIDVFHPDGQVTGCENAADIARLYATTFKGRKLFTRDGPRDTLRGLYKTPG